MLFETSIVYFVELVASSSVPCTKGYKSMFMTYLLSILLSVRAGLLRYETVMRYGGLSAVFFFLFVNAFSHCNSSLRKTSEAMLFVMFGFLLLIEVCCHFGAYLGFSAWSRSAGGADATFEGNLNSAGVSPLVPEAFDSIEVIPATSSSGAGEAPTARQMGRHAARTQVFREISWLWHASFAWSARRIGGARRAFGRRANWRRRKRPKDWARFLLLSGGMPLLRHHDENKEESTKVDELRGGGGGLGAKVTRRKRTERMMADLSSLMSQWCDEEEDELDDLGPDDPVEAFLAQLQQIIWDRPPDPVKAVGAFLKQWTHPHTALKENKTWEAWEWPATPSSQYRKDWSFSTSADDGHWDSWTSEVVQSAQCQDDWPSTSWSWSPPSQADAVDGEPWQEVSRKRRKKKQPVRQVRLEQPAKAQDKKADQVTKRGSGMSAPTKRTAVPLQQSDWCPRADDWMGDIKIAKSFADIAANPTRGFVAYPPDEAELEKIRTFIQSAEEPPDITIVVLKGCMEESRVDFQEVAWQEMRLPGICKNQLRVANAWVASCSEAAPSPKTCAKIARRQPFCDTVVLLAHSDWVYYDSEIAWQKANENPGQHFRKWAQQAIGHVRDTWQWQLVHGPGGKYACIEGRLRLPTSQVSAALKASGARFEGARWFISNVSRTQQLEGVPEIAVDWVEWQDNETWHSYIGRARKLEADSTFGLARGYRQVGLRRAATEEDKTRPRTVRRLWRAAGIPRDWSFEDVELFVAEAGFKQVDIDQRAPWRGATAWTFKATMGVEVDFKAIPIDDDGSVELTRLGRHTSTPEVRSLPMEWKQVFSERVKPAARVMHDRAVKSGDADVPASAVEPASTTDAMEEVTRLDDGKTVARSAGDGSAKRRKAVASDTSDIPLGMRLVDNEGQGNCLFASVSEALAAQGRSRRTSMEIRNLAVTHLRTHAKKYEGFWLGDAPSADGEDMKEEGFSAYLKRLGREGAWGGSLELSALATTLNQPIFVFRPGDDGVRSFNGSARGTPLCLWFACRHYQALVGAQPKQALLKAKPASIGDRCDRGGVPDPVPLSGASAVSRASSLGGHTHSCAATLSSLGGATVASCRRDPSPEPCNTPAAPAGPAAGPLTVHPLPALPLRLCHWGCQHPSQCVCSRELSCSPAFSEALPRCSPVRGEDHEPGLAPGLAATQAGSVAATPHKLALPVARTKKCSWPSAADVRILRDASASAFSGGPPCASRASIAPPRKRMRSKTKPWTTLSCLDAGPRISRPDASSSEGGREECEPPRSKPPPAYSWTCEVPGCTFTVTHARKHSIATARYRHNKYVHDNANQVGRPSARILQPIQATDGVTLGWTCPFCDSGFPASEWDSVSSGIRYRSIRAHRVSSHPHVTRKAWTKRSGTRKVTPLLKQRRRALNLNAAAPAAAMRGFDTFLWPWRPSSRKALCVRRAWRCQSCKRCLTVRSQVRQHSCTPWDPARDPKIRDRRIAALSALEPLVQQAGFQLEDYRRIVQRCLQAFRGQQFAPS